MTTHKTNSSSHEPSTTYITIGFPQTGRMIGFPLPIGFQKKNVKHLGIIYYIYPFWGGSPNSFPVSSACFVHHFKPSKHSTVVGTRRFRVPTRRKFRFPPLFGSFWGVYYRAITAEKKRSGWAVVDLIPTVLGGMLQKPAQKILPRGTVCWLHLIYLLAN